MLLTLTTTHVPATDLGFLLHKHPDRAQTFSQSYGVAHVFYPEAGAERCTVALLLEIDPVALVRGRQGRSGFALEAYVNDRPYVSASFMATALNDVFRSALAGRCQARPELAGQALPLEITLTAVPCRGGAELAERFFGPLGWQVHADPMALDPLHPEWGSAVARDLTLKGTSTVQAALSHLYVLLPVLDNAKHYWVSDDEVDKLLRSAADWLPDHPERDLITRRYLAHRRSLTDAALDRLAEIEDVDPQDWQAVPEPPSEPEPAHADDRPPTLAEQRRAAVLDAVRGSGATAVADLGCGEGHLIKALLNDRQITRLVGTDVSARALQLTRRRVRYDQLREADQHRLEIFTSALTYVDDRLRGLDAAVLMEVIEHVDPPRLPALERAVFGHARPRTVVITTPNAEHNVRFESLPAGAMRHHDHRFEWTRQEFANWTAQVAKAYGYEVQLRPVGPDDPEVGPPTQLAVLTRTEVRS